MLIKGWTDEQDETHVSVDGVELKLKDSLKIVNHSPTGFAWGYLGSGPAQTALAILLHVTKDAHAARRFYMEFKAQFVARWSWRDGNFEEKVDVIGWLADKMPLRNRVRIVNGQEVLQ